MDPIGAINIKKDSSFAMALAAQARGWELSYMEVGDLYINNGKAYARIRSLSVRDDPASWFSLDEAQDTALSELDVILMRKDPPVDNEYLYATQILALAEHAGTLVVNRTQALRDANENWPAPGFRSAPLPLLSPAIRANCGIS